MCLCLCRLYGLWCVGVYVSDCLCVSMCVYVCVVFVCLCVFVRVCVSVIVVCMGV